MTSEEIYKYYKHGGNFAELIGREIYTEYKRRDRDESFDIYRVEAKLIDKYKRALKKYGIKQDILKELGY